MYIFISNITFLYLTLWLEEVCRNDSMNNDNVNNDKDEIRWTKYDCIRHLC